MAKNKAKVVRENQQEANNAAYFFSIIIITKGMSNGIPFVFLYQSYGL